MVAEPAHPSTDRVLAEEPLAKASRVRMGTAPMPGGTSPSDAEGMAGVGEDPRLGAITQSPQAFLEGSHPQATSSKLDMYFEN